MLDHQYYHHQIIRFNDIFLPLIFTINIIAVLMLFFNKPTSIDDNINVWLLLATLIVMFIIEGAVYLAVNQKLFAQKR